VLPCVQMFRLIRTSSNLFPRSRPFLPSISALHTSNLLRSKAPRGFESFSDGPSNNKQDRKGNDDPQEDPESSNNQKKKGIHLEPF
jgi:hypothetical protein